MKFAVPVTPDAPTGRQWARDELVQPIYHPRQDPFSWLMEKITQMLDDLAGTSTGAQIGIWITIGLVLAGVIVLIVLIGPIRRRRRIAIDGALESSVVSAADLRAATRDRFAAARYREAYMLAFRAVVQDGIERTVVTAQPGLTAYEAATQLAQVFPGYAQQLMASATLFDATAYADQDIDRAEAGQMAELMRELARTPADWQGDNSGTLLPVVTA